MLLADDSESLRMGLRSVLALGGFEVVGEAADGAEAAALYERLRPDLLVTDIRMRPVSGLDALKSIFALDPTARVVILTSNPGYPELAGFRALHSLRAVLGKDAAIERMLEVFRAALL